MYNKKTVIQEWTMSSCVAPGLSEVGLYGSDGILYHGRAVLGIHISYIT